MRLTLGLILDSLGTTLCEIPDIHFKEIFYMYSYMKLLLKTKSKMVLTVDVKFYIRGSMHRNSRLKKSNEMQQYADILCVLDRASS